MLYGKLRILDYGLVDGLNIGIMIGGFNNHQLSVLKTNTLTSNVVFDHEDGTVSIVSPDEDAIIVRDTYDFLKFLTREVRKYQETKGAERTKYIDTQNSVYALFGKFGF